MSSELEVHATVPPSPRAAFLGIQAEELTRTGLLTAYLFVASAVFVMGRTARDAIFLSAYGTRAPALLPWMFVAYGVASALVAVGYTRLAGTLRRDRLVLGFTLLAAATYLLARGALALGFSWLPAVFYVWAEVVGNLALVQFWSVANDLHDARSARRLFGVIGVGRTLGVLVCGLGTSGIVHEVGTDNLLLVVVGLMGCIAGLTHLLARDHGLGKLQQSPEREREGLGGLLRDPYVRLLAGMLVLGFIAINVGDFQFKAAARLAHPDRDGLARFMSLFYATLGAFALVVQLVVTPWMLRRHGVLGGALALPVGFLTATALFLASPSIQTAVVLKISDNGLQFTLFDAALQLFYFPLPAEARVRVKSFLEAIAKPAGYGLGGLLVVALRAFTSEATIRDISLQSVVVVPIVLGWIALLPRVHARYLDALRKLLARRPEEGQLSTINDASTRRALTDALSDPSPRVVRFALTQLEAVDPDAARGHLPALYRSPHASVRTAALETAERLGDAAHLDTIRGLLDDPDDPCAAAAIHAFAKLEGEDATPSLTPLALSRRREVQDAALGALLEHGGLEGTLVAGRVLEDWLASGAPEDRRRAAELFARPGIPGLSRVIRRLLRDHDLSVRRAALVAAGASRDPRTLQAVMEALEDPHCEQAALRTLAAIGPAAVPDLARALSSPATPRHVRLALPRALQLIATREAFEVLLNLVDEDDPWVRQKVLAAASRIRGRQGFVGLPPRLAATLMERELQDYARLRGLYGPVRASLSMPLLEGFVLDRLKKALVRVLRVAELALPHAQVSAARDQLFSSDPARRAGAIELCENLLSLDVRRRFVSAVDDLLTLRATPLPEAPPGPVSAASALAGELVNSPDPYARLLGLDVVQYRGASVPFELVFALLRDASPAVREVAALTLAVRQPGGWRDALEPLTDDHDDCVRRYVRFVLDTGHTGMDPGDEMYNTLEKVLFLQRIPLFAEVTAEHLVALARAAAVEHRPAGEVVFSEGDAGDALFFVIEGRVQVTAHGRDVAHFSAGEVFGEMSVLDSSPRSATVTVLEDATLLRIGQEDFYEVLHATTELAEGVIHVLVRRLRATTVSG